MDGMGARTSFLQRRPTFTESSRQKKAIVELRFLSLLRVRQQELASQLSFLLRQAKSIPQLGEFIKQSHEIEASSYLN